MTSQVRMIAKKSTFKDNLICMCENSYDAYPIQKVFAMLRV